MCPLDSWALPQSHQTTPWVSCPVEPALDAGKGMDGDQASGGWDIEEIRETGDKEDMIDLLKTAASKVEREKGEIDTMLWIVITITIKVDIIYRVSIFVKFMLESLVIITLTNVWEGERMNVRFTSEAGSWPYNVSLV